MICSWKKDPTSPCSCAYQLRGSLPELLNHLCCLGESTLILRQQGLSLAKVTRFGLAVAYGDHGWDLLSDRTSGLETDTRTERRVYLMTSHPDRRPLICMGAPGAPIDLSIRLEKRLWDSAVVRNLIDCFDGVPLACHESRKLGAGAWLDDWERPVQQKTSTRPVSEILEWVRGSDWLNIEVTSVGHRGTANFKPSFIDCSSSVLRIADREMRHIVNADAADPSLQLEYFDGTLMMKKLPPTPLETQGAA